MRNQTVIRTLIREMLNERDRFSKEKGRSFKTLDDRGIDLEKMSKEEIAPGVPRYYFNMSNSFVATAGHGEKVKVTPMATMNPNAAYVTTPIGFYVYPLDKKHLTQFKSQSLPFMSNARWMTIIEAKSADNMLFMGNNTDRRIYHTFREALVKDYKIENGESKSPASRFTKILLGDVEFSRPITTIRSFEKERKEVEWAQEQLNNRQVDWVYDPGKGEVHKNEPVQAVFLAQSAFRVVEKLEAAKVFEELVTSKRPGEVYDMDDPSSNGEGASPKWREEQLIKKAFETGNEEIVKKLLNHRNPKIRNAALSRISFNPVASLNSLLDLWKSRSDWK